MARRRWWPVSVRWSTALTAALLCAVVLGVTWYGVRQFVLARVSGNAISATHAQLDRLAEAYRLGGREALASAAPPGDALFEVVTDSGQLVVRSANLTRWDPAWAALPPAPQGAPADWQSTGQATLRPGSHPHWREYRTYTVLSRVVESAPAELVEPLGREVSTVAGQLAGSPSAQRYRLTVHLFVLPWEALSTVRLLDELLRFVLPLAVLLTGLAAYFATGRALRPVEAIRRELAEVSERRLDRRVPMPASRDEIARLAATTNETLDRLQRAHLRQERFVADASHELRSPLASLRTGLEVALTHPDRVDWPEIAHRSLLDVQRLQRITADLLQLSVDPGPAPSTVVDLAEVVAEQVAERTHLGGPAVESIVDGPAPVRGEVVQLERLLRNLLDNAARHARGRVSVQLARAGDQVVLEVCDDGPGIPEPERERVFDRFARLDDARARDAGGSGLGLTLARDIALRHGGSLRVEDSASGARLVARLPCSDAAQD